MDNVENHQSYTQLAKVELAVDSTHKTVTSTTKLHRQPFFLQSGMQN